MKRSNRTKVLFMLPNLQAGGAERTLITLMNNINRNRFEPVFLALNDKGPIREWIAADITLHSFGKNSLTLSIFKLIGLIQDIKPDVIFTTMVHINALALLMKIRFPHIRVIVREAALPSALLTQYGIKGRLCLLIYKLLYSRADLVLSNCSQIIDQFKNIIKISTHNHFILFNPVDTKSIFSKIPAQFETDNKREETIYFACVGRLSFEKGYDRLLEAISVHFKPKNNWRLDIIGEGPYRAKLEKLVSELHLEKHIFLQGFHTQPWQIAAQSDCLLLPSRWEGMPNVVLEGQSCGVPCIAMREAGGISDIAKYTNDKHLIIVDTMAAFIKAMNNVKIVPKARRARSILNKDFCLPRIMEQFDTILEPPKKAESFPENA